MKIYRMVKVFEVGQGTLVSLSAEQVRSRQHRLDHVGEGLYRTKEPLQFKAGERVGLVDYVIPKAHADHVELLADDGAAEPELAASVSAPASGWADKRKRPR